MTHLLACLLLAAGAMASAQAPAPKPGTVVRVDSAGVSTITGTLLPSPYSHLAVRKADGGEAIIPGPDIWTVATFGPQRGRGARSGAAAGAIVGGAALAAALWIDFNGKSECICIPLSFVVAPFAVALPVVGASVGALHAPFGWGPAINHRFTHISAPPDRTGHQP
jgi:hypothetical protein